MINLVARVGEKFLALISYIGGVTSLFAYSFSELFSRDVQGRQLIRQIIVKQIYYTANQAAGSISIIALVLGGVTVFFTSQLAGFVGEGIIGTMLVTVLVRELGPLLIAIILIGRSGTAIATEIANMMVSDEFDALEAMGVDPLRFIVYPRLMAMIISLTALVILFTLVGLVGGYLAASMIPGSDLEFTVFINSVFSTMTVIDLAVVLFKAFTMGAAIAVISVMQGFKVGRSPTMVPVAATRSVVNSLSAIILMDGIITVFSYI